MTKLLIVVAAITGFCGVGVGALADHAAATPDAHMLMDIASRYLLIHAAALLGVAILAERTHSMRSHRIYSVSALIFVVALICFAGGIILRAVIGTAAPAFEIPIGGTLLMLAWLLVAVAALL